MFIDFDFIILRSSIGSLSLQTPWEPPGIVSFFAIHNFSNIQVEKVEIKNSLNATRYNCNSVNEVFLGVAIVPIDNVQGSVKSKEEKVMTCDSLGCASFSYHLQLRHDGNGFEINRECPQKLHWRKIVVNKEGEPNSWYQNEFDSKLVTFFVVSWSEFDIAEINSDERNK